MRSAFLLLPLIFCIAITAQVEPIQIGTLPNLIDEASGLQCPNAIECWTLNDNNDGSRLFKVDQTGTFISQLILNNASQIDYEDIARGQDGRYFIGDFGNNQNDREDLTIYITEDLETVSGTTVDTESISFSFSDQSAFPPPDEEKNFDIEAMIQWNDSLYLFSRNRTNPYNGWTKIYSLPDQAGEHEALLIDSIFGNLSSTYNSVTGADINPSGQRIVLCTNGAIFLITDFDEGFSSASIQYNFFSTTRPYEGISFIDECSVLLVEEGNPGGIYSLNTCDILTHMPELEAEIELQISNGMLRSSIERSFSRIEVIDISGRCVHRSSGRMEIPLNSLKNGIYLVRMFESGQSHVRVISVQY
ncbi:MAG: hypothetical protein HKN79_01895 [Flavobacteriales bacterium]|nr:hypothetical protein [Flavobacteriales bacterium]